VISRTGRWLSAFVVAGVCLRGEVSAQPLWRPVGPPTHSETGQLISGNAAHTINLMSRGRAHVWLQWDDPTTELSMTVWRGDTLLGSSASIGSLAHYLHIDPAQASTLTVRVTERWRRGSGGYSIRIWQDERLKWFLDNAAGPLITVGQHITVVEAGARRVKFRITEIDPNRLVTIHDGGPREIPVTRVTSIQRGDSLLNGALIGFAAGSGFALSRLGDCEINCHGAFVPVLGAIGAGIGTLVDLMTRRTTLHTIANTPE
jgi:hypothetical protein